MFPVIVIGVGRSGTTFLMRALASHPQIVAHEQYPLEFGPFLLSLFPSNRHLRSNAESGRYRFQNDEHAFYNRDKISFPDVVAIYQAIAAEQGKEARCFAEKTWPDLVANDVVATHAPQAKCIGLIRDPRDILISARAFDKRRGFRGFREQDGDTDEQVVLKYRQAFEQLTIALQSSPGHRVVRYEDLVRSPVAALSGIYDWIGVTSGVDVTEAAINRATTLEDGTHTTAASLQESVGRWRREMSSPLRDFYREHLGEMLTRFGYPTT